MALAATPSLLALAPSGESARRPPVRRHWLPGGDVGIYQTLSAMQRLARLAAHAPAIVAVAQAAVGSAPDATAQWQNLRAWLAAHVRFTDDPVGIELVRTPLEQLRLIQRDGVMHGDCDDAATLSAALVLALGARARYVVLGFFEPGPAAPYRHVFTEMETAPGIWRDLDVTRRQSTVPASRRATVPV